MCSEGIRCKIGVAVHPGSIPSLDVGLGNNVYDDCTTASTIRSACKAGWYPPLFSGLADVDFARTKSNCSLSMN